MELKDKKEFGEVLAVMGEVYERQLSNNLLELYFKILQQYSIGQIKTAVSSHLQDKKAGQYFPKPADLIRAIEGDDEGRAIAAWVEVRNAIRTVGYYQSVKFDDPVIMMCIDRMGGWMELCNILTSEVGYKEAEFIKLYKHYQRFPIENAPNYLPGYHEVTNRFGGYDYAIPEPVEIRTGRQLPPGKENRDGRKKTFLHKVCSMD